MSRKVHDRRPAASSPEVAQRMSRLGRRDTKPEVEVRRLLHGAGLRFRVDHPPLPGLRTRADVVFTRQKLALYVDGCFWHRCPEHFVVPKSNTVWWLEKIDGNVARDRRTTAALEDAGWTVVRAWEHEPPSVVAERVVRHLEALRPGTFPAP